MDNQRKKCILFVDDEANILSGLRRMLRSQRNKWDLVFANSGKEALEILQTRKVDLLVSDMRMPEMDGAQLLDVVAAKHPEVIRLVLSGQSQKKKILQIVSTAHQFLAKPCDTQVLINKIQESLDLFQGIDNPFVRESLANTRSIKSTADVHEKLVGHLESKDSTEILNVCKLVSQDIGTTAKIMQLVSSSFFGAGTSDTLETACEQLGCELLGELFDESTAFSPADESQLPEVQNGIRAINEHSFQVAHLARRITASECRESSARAHLAGILHDMGKVIMLQNWPESYLPILEAASDSDSTLELELRYFGITHAEIGAHLLKLWGIHDEILFVARYHHSPEDSPVQNFGPLASVFVANTFLSYPDSEIEARSRLENSEFIKRIGCVGKIDAWFDAMNGMSLESELSQLG